MTSIARLLTASFALTFASGCFFVQQQPPIERSGDLSFLWSFDGEERCTNAGVSEITVLVDNQAGTEVFNDTFTCSGGGLTIRDFAPQTHTVTLIAYGFDDEKLYEGSKSAYVESDFVTDMGVIEIDRLRPDVLQGDVTFTWAFLYPSSLTESNCGRAGVNEVDVRLIPTASNNTGVEYIETFSCADAGVAVTLNEGSYVLTLDAYRTGATDLHLYESVEIDVVIISGNPLALGDVELLRLNENFGDIEVDWSLPSNCTQLGIETIDFIVTRVATDEEEVSFTVDCDASITERIDIFVPGSYVIEAAANGIDDDYIGLTTFTVEPNAISDVVVDLVSVQN